MGTVIVKVSDKGFDKEKYMFRIDTKNIDKIPEILLMGHDVKFELQDSLEKVTISCSSSSEVGDWLAKALKEVPVLNIVADELRKSQTTQFTVSLDSKNREVTKKVKLLTVFKATITDSTIKATGMTIGSGTTSGTIEVSGGLGEGKPD